MHPGRRLLLECETDAITAQPEVCTTNRRQGGDEQNDGQDDKEALQQDEPTTSCPAR